MTLTVEYLQSVLKAWKIRRCDACGEYELPQKGGGVGGIQADDMGNDREGRTVHMRCTMTTRRG